MHEPIKQRFISAIACCHSVQNRLSACSVLRRRHLVVLTFKNRASYVQDGRTATLQMLHFIYFF